LATGRVRVQHYPDPTAGRFAVTAGACLDHDAGQRLLAHRLRYRPGRFLTWTSGCASGLRQWVSVDVTLRQDAIRIGIDGGTRVEAHLPADSLWARDPGQIVLGEVHGAAQIRLAQVRTRGYAVNYICPGALSIPASHLYLPDHTEPFPSLPRGLEQWLIVFLEMLSFVPVGFFILRPRRPPVRPMVTGLLGAALVVVLAAGKFLFHARHTSPAIVVMDGIGTLLGHCSPGLGMR
jgi:hypothetical protein